MTVAPAKYGSIFELARSVNAVQQAALHRIYEFAIGHPRCRATPQLRDKYGEPFIVTASSSSRCWQGRAVREPSRLSCAVLGCQGSRLS